MRSAALAVISRLAVIAALAGAATLLPEAPGVAGPVPAAAQEVLREVQVPVLPERGLVEIGPELRRGLDLFPGIQGFVAARLFSLEDGGHVLEITRREDGRVVRERRPFGPAALGSFRADLGERLALRGEQVVRVREGRGGLVLGQTLLGLGYHGWALPQALGVESGRGLLAGYLLTAGLGFYMPYWLTRDVSVTDAHRNLSLWGGTRGIVYGLALGNAISGDDPDDDDQWELGMGVAGSVAGSVLGFKAVDWDRPTPTEGTADLWGLMGDVGLIYGFATATGLGLYDTDDVQRPGGDVFGASEGELRLGHALGMAGGIGGLAFGYWLGDREDYTVGDVHVVRTFGAMGGQVVLPLLDLVDTDDRATWIFSTMAGTAGGFWSGNRLLRSQSFSGGEGLIVSAGHLAGGLGALGVTYLIDDGRSDALLYLSTAAVGSGAGLALTWAALAEREGPPPVRDPGAHLELNTAALPLLLDRGRGEGPLRRIPLVTVRF